MTDEQHVCDDDHVELKARVTQLREALETIRDEAHDLILFAEGEGHAIAMTDHHKDCYAIVKHAEAVLRDSVVG